MAQAAWYDYLIVNDDLTDAIADFESVLRATRCQRIRQSQLLRALLGRTPPARPS
jgi:guanylate kinase